MFESTKSSSTIQRESVRKPKRGQYLPLKGLWKKEGKKNLRRLDKVFDWAGWFLNYLSTIWADDLTYNEVCVVRS